MQSRTLLVKQKKSGLWLNIRRSRSDVYLVPCVVSGAHMSTTSVGNCPTSPCPALSALQSVHRPPKRQPNVALMDGWFFKTRTNHREPSLHFSTKNQLFIRMGTKVWKRHCCLAFGPLLNRQSTNRPIDKHRATDQPPIPASPGRSSLVR